jgi:hypothetical protein
MTGPSVGGLSCERSVAGSIAPPCGQVKSTAIARIGGDSLARMYSSVFLDTFIVFLSKNLFIEKVAYYLATI